MQYYTYIRKLVHCPIWNVDVTLSAKYFMSANDDTPYKANFAFAECPIYQNGQKHVYDQEPALKLMYCPDKDACKLLREFPREVDVRYPKV